MSIKYANADILSVSTVSDLFSLKSIKDNQLVQTQGYSTEGVGANLYRYDASGAATVNGGFVLPGLNGTLSFSGTTFNGTSGTGQFIAVDRSVADVTQFGAKGDGATDDAQSINLAISSIGTAGGTVFFPIGQFVINSTITIEDKGPLTIEGVSNTLVKGSTAVHSSQIAPYASFGATTAVFDVVSNNANNVNDHGGVTFKNIMIRPLSGVRGYGINVRKGSGDTSFWGDIKLDNVCVRYCTNGLRFNNSGGSGFGWIHVDKSRIEACTYGVLSDCAINSSVFRDSIIRQNTQSAAGTYITRTGGSIIIPYGDSILIQGCDLEGSQVGIKSGASNVSVKDCYFEVNFDASIVLTGCINVSIESNYFAKDTKCGQVYCSSCKNIVCKANENIIPVLFGTNTDCFFENPLDVILTCTGGANSSTNDTLTVSNVSSLLWSEDMLHNLEGVGLESTHYPVTVMGGTITNKTQGVDGPFNRNSLVLIAESETSKTYVAPLYQDLNSAAIIKSVTFTADSGTDVLTTSSAHGYLDGEQVCFYTTGSLPSGITTAKWYYVINKTSTTFQVSLTHGGSAIDLTTNGSGTLYVTKTGEFVAQNFWLRSPSSNSSSAPYIEHRHGLNGSDTGSTFYIGTIPSAVFEEDKWYLLQIIEKIPCGLLAASGGYDCNSRIYQLAVGDKNEFAGAAITKTRKINVYPKHFMFSTDIANEGYRQIDDRHYIGSAAPTSTVFSWGVGTQIEYLAPSGGGNIGLVCTVSGAPGTWKTFGAITA